MTPQEALRHFEEHLCKHCCEWDKSLRHCNTCPTDTAKKSLEKQQTTKYKHLGTRHTHWGKCRHDKFRCETCGFTKEFTDNHTAQYKFCPSCGREIDWSSKPKGNDCDFMFIDEVIAYDTQKND